MDEFDDLINDIIGDKPQEKKSPEAFLVDEPKVKPNEIKVEKNEDQPLKWAKVPARKRNPYCGFCKKRLTGGESHWKLECEDRKGKFEVYWWCRKCLDGILEPPKT